MRETDVDPGLEDEGSDRVDDDDGVLVVRRDRLDELVSSHPRGKVLTIALIILDSDILV